MNETYKPSVPRILYDTVSPHPDTPPLPEPCYLCGGPVWEPIPAKFRDTFVDYDKARAPLSPHICQACAFSMQERSTTLAKRVGKDKPQLMRNYSHIVLHGVWYPLSKAQKTETYALLLQLPEVAVIAVSGQKHLLFRARPGLWQVEEQAVIPDVATLQAIMEHVQALYDAGFGKAQIQTGEYSSYMMARCDLAAWQQHETALRRWRGSALFELAIYLVQKTEDVADESGATDRPMRPSGVVSVARDGQGVQAKVRAGDLGPVSESAPGRGDDDGQSGSVRQLPLL